MASNARAARATQAILRRLRSLPRHAAGGTARGYRASIAWLRHSVAARRTGLAAALVVVSAAAAGIGVFLGGVTGAEIGPFHTTLALEPSTASESVIHLPPLGSLILDSHDSPFKLTVRLDSLDQSAAERVVADPDGVAAVSDSIEGDVTVALIGVALRALGAAALAGLAVGALVFRNMRRTAICGGLSILVTMSTFGLAAATLRPQAIAEPRYEGLLTNAPSVVGSAQDINDDYERYVNQLQTFVTNISQFYTIARSLPSFEPDPGMVRVLHVSDLHNNPAAWDIIYSVVTQFQIDVVVDTGDMNDWGTEQEADTYTDGLGRISVPYVYVQGNHDSEFTVEAVEEYPNAIVLDNDVQEVAGLTFAGISDPRFTPDKDAQPGDIREEQMMLENGATLRQTIENAGDVDVACIHDPVSAQPLAGSVPLVLSGHRHRREVTDLGQGTTLMVEGSTGAAGLRGLQGDEPLKLDLSVLYISSDDGTLKAFDNISVGALGETNIALQRHVVGEEGPEEFVDEDTPSDTVTDGDDEGEE